MQALIDQLPKTHKRHVINAIILYRQGNPAALYAARRVAATRKTATIIQTIIDTI
jgi:hypothetical protein